MESLQQYTQVPNTEPVDDILENNDRVSMSDTPTEMDTGQKTNIIAVSHQNRIGQFLKLHCTNNTVDQAQNEKIRFLNGAVVKIEFDNNKNATIKLLYAGNDNSVKGGPYYQTDEFINSKFANLKYYPVPFKYTLKYPTTYGRKKTVIYLVRHGEAWHNANPSIQGTVADTLLTKAGCEQTEGSAQAIFDDLDTYKQSEIIYYASSDLNRARETMYKIQAKIFLLNKKNTKSNRFARLSLPTTILIVPCLHERVVKNKLKNGNSVLVSMGGRENYLKPRIIGTKLGLGSIESDTTSKTNCDKKQSPYYFSTPKTQLNNVNYDATYYHTFYDKAGSYNQRYNTFVRPGKQNTISEIELRCESPGINILRMILNTIEMRAAATDTAATAATASTAADTADAANAAANAVAKVDIIPAPVGPDTRQQENAKILKMIINSLINLDDNKEIQTKNTLLIQYISNATEDNYNIILDEMNELSPENKDNISRRINDYIDDNYMTNEQNSNTDPQLIRLNNLLDKLKPITKNEYHYGGKKSRRNKKIRRNKSKKLRKSHKINYTFISSNTGNRISNLKRNLTKHRKHT